MSVRVEKEEGILVVTIDRPSVRNAVDRATAQRLADAFRAFETDDEARVAILTGAGGSFCAGADLKAVARGEGNRLDPEGDAPMGPTRMTLSKPVIAAVAGHAVGGGFELALWCDLRVVEEDAVFGFLNRKWGVPLIDGGTIRLPRLIGHSRAMDLILTGREVRAMEAMGLGIANRVVPKGEALREARSLALAIAQHPPHALHGDRLSAIEQWSMSQPEALVNEYRRGEPALRLETVEGARRFAR